MTTKLDHRLKRELQIDGGIYTLTIAPDALHLVPKGRRKGLELRWVDLVSGDAALAAALNASLTAAILEPAARTGSAPKTPKPKGPERPRSSRKRAPRRRS